MSLPTDIAAITQTDLQRLVDERVQEGRHIDFKRELPTVWDRETKNDVVADASAFANAVGGDIVYGIAEGPAKDGTAEAICPQSFDSVDLEVRRLQDLLLDLIEPRLPGVQVQAVEVELNDKKGHAIVIRVPQSWAAPHRVTGNRHFYVRDGLRKRAVDVPELRGLFLRTESQAQRVRDWRSDRLAKILMGETPTPLMDGPKLVVHVVPTRAALGLVAIDPVPYFRGQKHIPMMGQSSGWAATLNFDGAYVSLSGGGFKPNLYSQLFRNGFFEAVAVVEPRGGIQEPLLPDKAYENDINLLVGRIRGELDRQGIRWDVAVFLSLLGADKVRFALPSDTGYGIQYRKFDRRDLLLPEVLISAEVSPGRGMRPTFDLMCQAAGMAGSANYGEDGEWKAGR